MNQKHSKLPKHQQFFIQSFTGTFLTKERSDLWNSVLLEMESKYWDKITPWDLWDEQYSIIKYCKEWRSDLRTLSTTSFISKYINLIVLIVYIGHDRGRIEYRMLSEIFSKEVFILDGIVIIEPYHLALAINHDGDICVCQKQT